MASNMQQNIFQVSNVQQFPVQQFPVQQTMQGPMMQTNNVQTVHGGLFGRRKVNKPVEHKDVFNDDEALI